MPYFFYSGQRMIPSILHNYRIKLVALTFAVFIWFFVVTENDYEDIVAIPIIVNNLPRDKVLLNDVPKQARIKVKGSGKDLIALGVSRSARLDVDLTGVRKSRIFHPGPDDVFLSRSGGGLSVLEVTSPETISVVLDDFMDRKVPIRSRLQVSSAPGYALVGNLHLSPDSVVVSGPKSVVRQIDYVPTDSLVRQNLVADLSESVRIGTPLSSKAKLSTDRTEAHLDVQKLLELTFTGIPVTVRHAPRNINVYPVPSTLDLVVEGGADLLSKLDRKDIVAYVDYRRVKSSPANELPAIIERPPGVTYRDVSPRTFKLVFEKRRSGR